MKKKTGTLRELLEEATKQIEKMTPEEKLETKKAIQQSFEKRQKEIDAERGAAPHPNEKTPSEARLMFCSRCGTKNPGESANCFNCGQKIINPPNVAELTNIDVKKFNQKLKDNLPAIKNDEDALNAVMHLFFFSAVDRNGATRFFDIKRVENGCSVGETATSAPILGPCVETNYANPDGNGRHHGHRIYGTYSTIDPRGAMQNFANFYGLTQIEEITETRNELELGATLSLIWQKLGCPATVSK